MIAVDITFRFLFNFIGSEGQNAQKRDRQTLIDVGWRHCLREDAFEDKVKNGLIFAFRLQRVCEISFLCFSYCVDKLSATSLYFHQTFMLTSRFDPRHM